MIWSALPRGEKKIIPFQSLLLSVEQDLTDQSILYEDHALYPTLSKDANSSTAYICEGQGDSLRYAKTSFPKDSKEEMISALIDGFDQ